MQPAPNTILPVTTATRLARLADFISTEGTLRHARTLAKIANGGRNAISHDEIISLSSFVYSEGTCRLYRDLNLTLYPRIVYKS
jgi:hypothetical protein